jgi:hypothetical protein
MKRRPVSAGTSCRRETPRDALTGISSVATNSSSFVAYILQPATQIPDLD